MYVVAIVVVTLVLAVTCMVASIIYGGSILPRIFRLVLGMSLAFTSALFLATTDSDVALVAGQDRFAQFQVICYGLIVLGLASCLSSVIWFIQESRKQHQLYGRHRSACKSHRHGRTLLSD